MGAEEISNHLHGGAPEGYMSRYLDRYLEDPTISRMVEILADMKKAQLGLGHSFSRSKCATDVNR